MQDDARTTATRRNGPEVHAGEDGDTRHREHGGDGLRPVAWPGLVIEDYELLTLLGIGGMGEVWEARRRSIGGRVAIKIIRRTAFESLDASPALIEEFRLLRDIDHPHVCAVLNAGRVSLRGRDVPWVAMRLVPGARTLNEYAMTRSPAERLRVVRDVVSGLACAHEHGVKHLDVKPQNILVDKDGRAVLIDFGLARLRIGDRNERRAGTPRYMSPELQSHFSDADQRADIWSCGIVIAEVMNAVDPPDRLDASTAAQECGRHVKRGLEHEYPRLATELQTVVGVCLQEELADRYQNAGDLVTALGAIMEVEHQERWVIENRQRTRCLRVSLCAILAAVAGVLAAFGVGSAAVHLVDEPQAWYGRFLGTPRDSLSALPVFPNVALVAVDDLAIERVAARPEFAEFSVIPHRRETVRPVHAATLRRLADAGASVIVLDIFFRSSQPHDHLLADAIWDVRAGGVGVAVGVKAMTFEDGRPDTMTQVIWSSEPAWGVMSMNDQPDGLCWTYAATEREGVDVMPSLAVAAFAEFASPGALHHYEIIDDRLRIRHYQLVEGHRGQRRRLGESWIEPTAMSTFTSNIEAADGSLEGDQQWSLVFHPPSQTAVDASTVDLDEVWDLSIEELRSRVANRIVVIFDRDRDTRTDFGGIRGSVVHASAIQALLLNRLDRIADHWNIALLFFVGLLSGGLVVALQWGAQVNRHAAIGLAWLGGAIAAAAVTWLTHALTAVWLNAPLALVAALTAGVITDQYLKRVPSQEPGA